MGVSEILALGDRLAQGELRLKEVVKDAEEEDTIVENEQRKQNVLDLIEQVRKLDLENQSLQKKIKAVTTVATKKKHRDKIKSNKDQLTGLFKGTETGQTPDRSDSPQSEGL